MEQTTRSCSRTTAYSHTHTLKRAHCTTDHYRLALRFNVEELPEPRHHRFVRDVLVERRGDGSGRLHGGDLCRGQEQPSRPHVLVHYQKHEKAHHHQHAGGHDLGERVQARLVRVERPGRALLGGVAPLGGQSAGQRRECERLREGQLVQ